MRFDRRKWNENTAVCEYESGKECFSHPLSLACASSRQYFEYLMSKVNWRVFRRNGISEKHSRELRFYCENVIKRQIICTMKGDETISLFYYLFHRIMSSAMCEANERNEKTSADKINSNFFIEIRFHRYRYRRIATWCDSEGKRERKRRRYITKFIWFFYEFHRRFNFTDISYWFRSSLQQQHWPQYQ